MNLRSIAPVLLLCLLLLPQGSYAADAPAPYGANLFQGNFGQGGAAGAIAPGDRVVLRLWGGSLNVDTILEVSPAGQLDIPEVGQLNVTGLAQDKLQDALRSKIGFVPQKAFLFSGTVSSNVGYGEDNASGAAIRKAVSIAQAAEFVESPEVGYSGTVAQGGSNFSGGQKQRLSIARAVARDPEILVFDDSFSALDYKTDHALRQALREQTSGTTNIIVAQRIGTIRDADCILVIEDGAIVGKGTHRELMESCKVYQEIAYSQLSKEELAS